MEKLLELEKKLKEYREELEKSLIESDDILEKGLGKDLETAEHRDRVSHALGSIRQPAKVTNAEGEEKIVSPKEQVSEKVSAQKQKATSAKVKAEAEAAARRAQYKKQGLMKNNLQWELE